MTRFLLGAVCGLILMGSGVYAGDWYEDRQHNRLLEEQLEEQRRHNRDVEDQRFMDSIMRPSDPC